MQQQLLRVRVLHKGARLAEGAVRVARDHEFEGGPDALGEPGDPLEALGLDEVGDGTRVAGLHEVPGARGEPAEQDDAGAVDQFAQLFDAAGLEGLHEVRGVRLVAAVAAQQLGEGLLQAEAELGEVGRVLGLHMEPDATPAAAACSSAQSRTSSKVGTSQRPL